MSEYFKYFKQADIFPAIAVGRIVRLQRTRHSFPDRPVSVEREVKQLILFLFRVWGWGRLPGGGRRDPLLFRPKGAKTNQPGQSVAATAAERRPGYGF